ncbi:MAG: hypothetical protein K6C98_03285 [Treponema sp.]|nr:hypothetical protein [Treponema sp.]
MNIVIYSTNSNNFDGPSYHYTNLPSNAKNTERVLADFFGADCFTKHHFTIVSELPGMFLLDLQGNELAVKSEHFDYKILPQKEENQPEKVAAIIEGYKPDLVIAATYWVTPFDWLPIKDAQVAEILKAKGIKVICNTLDVSLMSFDKIQTHSFLELNGFPVAKAVYVHHELFWAERNRAELKENPYKESVFYRIKNMNFPVIIKDTSGLSSYGMEVCHTFGQVKNFLNGKKNNGDKIVEEFIKGPQFAMEIWGTPESGYKIFKPFMVSVNQYGITSPKQSVKIGPVEGAELFEGDSAANANAFPLTLLNSELLRLAKLIKVNGICQVDFGWDEENKRWVIFELNPRLSGMTQLQFESQLGCACGKERPAMSLKFPILEPDVLQKLSQIPFVKHVTQTVNDQAKQNREHGYCEVVLTAGTFNELRQNLITLDNEFSAFMEKSFFNTAMQLFSQILR